LGNAFNLFWKMSHLLDADYSGIEARITPWLAGQEDALEEYRRVDKAKTKEEKWLLSPYVIMASTIYSVPPNEVNKFPQRFVGKEAVLGCIAEGQLVLTDVGEIPIEQVRRWHRLWDGVEWVSHECVIYQGHKKVITYQGLTATPDHIVFTGMGFQRTTDLWTARKQELRLTVSGKSGHPIRTLDASLGQGFSEPERIPVHESGVQMRDSDVLRFPKFDKWQESGVRPLRAFGSDILPSPSLARETDGSRERALYDSSQSSVSLVWREGDKVQIQDAHRRSELDHGQPWFEEALDLRSAEQRWALRTWEYALRDYSRATREQERPNPFDLCPFRMAICRGHRSAVYESGVHTRADFGTGPDCSGRETEMLEEDQKTVATFDILNAGPRHRFTVSGKLVHNCGFGLGGDRFRVQCAKKGYELPEGLEFKTVKFWRKKNNRIVKFWTIIDDAAKRATVYKGEVCPAGQFISFKCITTGGIEFLMMRLPSGRKLAYPMPRIVPGKFEGTTSLSFYQNIKGKIWGHNKGVWGGLLTENAVQAVAADIMCNGAQNCEDNGYEIMALIHDQGLAYHGEGQTPERFVELLTDLPEWALGLPLAAEGGLVPFYKKD
jgi:DNA polymerase